MVVRYRAAIKELPEEMRPRERLVARGEQYLNESELLAILLGSGSRSNSALELADELLMKNDGIKFIKTMSLDELQAVNGIGAAKATRLKAAVELGRRLASSTSPHSQVSSPEEVVKLVMEDMRYYDREHFKCMYLNRKNHILALETISVGGLASSVVHPREVFKPAIKRSAAAVILIHNHPSGDPKPSSEDIAITRRLVEAGQLLGIEVLDHLVIGDGKYASMKTLNLW